MSGTDATASSATVIMIKGLPEMEAGQVKTLVGKIEHDLHHQLHKHEVPEQVMPTVADAGFTRSKLFRFFGETAK